MLYVQDHTLLSISSFVLLCPSLVAVMLCDILFWGEVWTNVFTLDRELKTDQLGEPMSIFLGGGGGWGVIWRNMGEVLPIGAEMTQRYLHHQRPIQAYVKAHKSWKPGARCTTQRQLNRLKSVLMGAWLVSASSIQLSLWVFTEAWLGSASKPSM